MGAPKNEKPGAGRAFDERLDTLVVSPSSRQMQGSDKPKMSSHLPWVLMLDMPVLWLDHTFAKPFPFLKHPMSANQNICLLSNYLRKDSGPGSGGLSLATRRYECKTTM